MTSTFLNIECPIFFIYTTGVDFKWQEPGKNINHQCTCKIDKASIVLLKIPSSPRCENVRLLQIFFRPLGPQLEKEMQASSPLWTALTLERWAEISHVLWRIPQINWSSYARGTIFRITAFWMTDKRIVLEKEELMSWESFLYP